MSRLAPLVALALMAASVPAQNCNGTSIGQTPINDLGSGTYRGVAGGLYPGGANARPAAHETAGLAQAALVRPLDAGGQPSPTGRIVLVSIGMSNTTQEFSTWVPVSNADPQRAAAVTVVDCAQGGQDARIVADPLANFWTVANQRLVNAGVTPAQVQAVWLKEAVAGPTLPFPQHAQELQGLLAQIARNLKSKFPNVRLCYMSSRIYAGYATSQLNPEPYAYESAFAVKWLVEAQVNGDPTLNFDPARGTVVAPWLSWGPYLWADGIRPRSDALTYVCSDFQSDGTHPNTGARNKVTAMLDAHFRGDTTTVPWYLGGGGTPRASFQLYGAGCPTSVGPVNLRTNGLPYLGNATFTIGVNGIGPGLPTLSMMALGRAQIALDPGCSLLVDPATLFLVIAQTSNAAGAASLRIPIPNDATLLGARLDDQWLVLDPQSPGLRMLGGGGLSAGGELRLGVP